MFHTNRFRAFVAIAAFAGALAFVAAEADAKPGGGGSRGMRTFSTPAPTATAPGGCQADRAHDDAAAAPGHHGTGAGGSRRAQGGMFGGRFGGSAAA